MGAAAAPLSLGLGGLSMIFDGISGAASSRYQAQEADRASQIALIQADQIDAQRRGELGDVISNIRAIRAATGVNPDSPSTRAVVAREERQSSMQRRIEVGNARLTAEQRARDALFYRRSARWSLLGGAIGGLTQFAKAAAAF